MNQSPERYSVQNTPTGEVEKLSDLALKESPVEKTSARFRLAINTILKLNFGKIDIKGLENLDKLGDRKDIIFATTHISDMDVIMSIPTLGRRFNIKAVNASLQHSFAQDPMSFLAMLVAGKDNALPVGMKYGNHEKAGKSYYPTSFNLRDFEPMKTAIQKGSSVIMAAYTPTPVKDGKLASKGGYGAVYLAEISGAVIVPIAINIKSQDPNMTVRKGLHKFKALIARPEAEIIIGEPIFPTGIGELKSDKTDESGHDGETDRAKMAKLLHARQELDKKSDRVMLALAKMLPKEKRGVWADRIGDSE